MNKRASGTILAARCKGVVVWQARISTDRGRLEVIGIVPASTAATVIEPLDERELRELLGEGTELHDDSIQGSGEQAVKRLTANRGYQ